jgi:hypothetical protein
LFNTDPAEPVTIAGVVASFIVARRPCVRRPGVARDDGRSDGRAAGRLNHEAHEGLRADAGD